MTSFADAHQGLIEAAALTVTVTGLAVCAVEARLAEVRARGITPVEPPRQPNPQAAEFGRYLAGTRRPHIADGRRVP